MSRSSHNRPGSPTIITTNVITIPTGNVTNSNMGLMGMGNLPTSTSLHDVDGFKQNAPNAVTGTGQEANAPSIPQVEAQQADYTNVSAYPVHGWHMRQRFTPTQGRRPHTAPLPIDVFGKETWTYSEQGPKIPRNENEVQRSPTKSQHVVSTSTAKQMAKAREVKALEKFNEAMGEINSAKIKIALALELNATQRKSIEDAKETLGRAEKIVKEGMDEVIKGHNFD